MTPHPPGRGVEATRTGSDVDPDSITPLILTRDEAPNLERTLARLDWARRVVVLDSHSTDDTAAIARRHRNVTVIERAFDDHASQWNFGIAQADTDWVLSLDADYVLEDGFAGELSRLRPGDLAGYYARLRYCVGGRALRGAILPPRCVLFRVDRARYRMDGHTQRLEVDGPTGRLEHAIRHDDRKSFSRWLSNQLGYAALEAAKLRGTAFSDLGVADRIRCLRVVAPWLVVIYCLVIRGGILDGWRGGYYALQRFIAEAVLGYYLFRPRCGPRDRQR